MSYMDLIGRWPKKTVKLTHSLTQTIQLSTKDVLLGDPGSSALHSTDIIVVFERESPQVWPWIDKLPEALDNGEYIIGVFLDFPRLLIQLIIR